jgi:hypothetical protein
VKRPADVRMKYILCKIQEPRQAEQDLHKFFHT